MSEPQQGVAAEPGPERRRQIVVVATVVGAIFTVVGVVIALLAWRYPSDAGGPIAGDATTPSGQTEQLSTPRETPSQRVPDPAPSLPSDAGQPVDVPLAHVERVTGELGELPDEIEDDPAFGGATVIECPTNNTGDQETEVTYETRLRYETFVADLYAYREPADDVRFQLHVFSDPMDREPGSAGGAGDPRIVEVTAGEAGEITAGIAEAYYLRLHVECEKPDGLLILISARVQSD